MPHAASAPYAPRRTATSRFVELRGLKHHLHEWGATPHGDTPQPLLLMMHGWMDVGASFQFTVDALQADRHVVAADWRGFGLTDSSGADAYWFHDYLADLDALIDHLSPDAPIDLLGHSMGGNIVMTYAGVRPQRIRRLINLEGFGMPQTVPDDVPKRLTKWLDQLRTAPALRDYASLDEVAARLMKTNPRLPPDKAAWLAGHWSRQAADGRWHILADAAHKLINPVLTRAEDVVATWQRIDAPLLWVQGDGGEFETWWDGRYSREQFHQRLAAVPRVQKVTLQQAGHMLHHDQPQALARELEAFLA